MSLQLATNASIKIIEIIILSLSLVATNKKRGNGLIVREVFFGKMLRERPEIFGEKSSDLREFSIRILRKKTQVLFFEKLETSGKCSIPL